jgi:hypothetical protein
MDVCALASVFSQPGLPYSAGRKQVGRCRCIARLGQRAHDAQLCWGVAKSAENPAGYLMQLMGLT